MMTEIFYKNIGFKTIDTKHYENLGSLMKIH